MNDELNRMERSQADRRAMLARWRASQLHEMELPSGLTVTVRDVDMQDIALSGEMPNTLLDIFLDQEHDIDQMPQREQVRRMLEGGRDFGLFLDLVVRKCVTDPQIGETADEEHITLAELRQSDKMAIFNWVNREALQARPFRPQQEKPVDAPLPGGDVRAEAEPDPGTADGVGRLAGG